MAKTYTIKHNLILVCFCCLALVFFVSALWCYLNYQNKAHFINDIKNIKKTNDNNNNKLLTKNSCHPCHLYCSKIGDIYNLDASTFGHSHNDQNQNDEQKQEEINQIIYDRHDKAVEFMKNVMTESFCVAVLDVRLRSKRHENAKQIKELLISNGSHLHDDIDASGNGQEQNQESHDESSFILNFHLSDEQKTKWISEFQLIINNLNPSIAFDEICECSSAYRLGFYKKILFVATLNLILMSFFVLIYRKQYKKC